MRRVALLVVLSLLLVPTVAGAQVADAPATPDTQIHIAVQNDGDARWSVTFRYPLETANDTAAFDRLRAEFTAGNAGLASVEPFREAATRVSERTDQDMAIESVERTAEVRSLNNTSVGHLTLSFTWTNFAEIGEEEVQVGEAFEGGWFGDLGPQQTLVIVPPDGYQVHNVDPLQSIVNGTLRWDGPQEFGPGQPVVTFIPVQQGPIPPTLPFTAPVFIGIGVMLGAMLIFAAWRRELFDFRSSEEPEPTVTEPESSQRAPEPPAEPTEPSPEPASEGEPDDLELLSDEERVERLLEDHGGRMRQAKIVEETRWSNAKVSQLLSAMADEGRVEKLRLGRENLISLPDEDET